MKTIIIIKIFFVSIYFFSSIALNAVNDSINNKKIPDIFDTDNTLKLISNFISDAWNVQLDNDTLKFINVSNIYSVKLKNDTLKPTRKQIKNVQKENIENAEIYFLIKDLWSAEKMNEILLLNSFYQNKINGLKTKYSITEKDEILITENKNIENTNLTHTDKKRLINYLNEKAKIQSNVIALPDYNTMQYSLFIIHINPKIVDKNNFIPISVINELENLIKIFDKYAGK